MEQHIIPADATIADLNKQAEDCDTQATKQPEPLATELREKAKLLREWIAQLRSHRWTA
jgi:hypothetical protein